VLRLFVNLLLCLKNRRTTKKHMVDRRVVMLGVDGRASQSLSLVRLVDGMQLLLKLVVDGTRLLRNQAVDGRVNPSVNLRLCVSLRVNLLLFVKLLQQALVDGTQLLQQAVVDGAMTLAALLFNAKRHLFVHLLLLVNPRVNLLLLVKLLQQAAYLSQAVMDGALLLLRAPLAGESQVLLLLMNKGMCKEIE